MQAVSKQKPGSGFLPNFCDVRNVFMLALLVELLSLVLTLASAERNNFWEQLSLISLFSQWLALIDAALLCIWRGWLNRHSVVKVTLYSFLILLGVTLLLSLAVIFSARPLGLYSVVNSDWVGYFLLRNLTISGLVYGVTLRYFYIHYQWEKNLQAQSLAQIQALKARIRPHFLFNSMNTIASLISIDSTKAEKAVEDLADLFRASLREDTQHCLANEIELTHSYVDIEQLRLGERLKVRWDLAEGLPQQLEMPALCLQPLVENAIYHGIEPCTQGGEIVISAQIVGNSLCLSVANPIQPGASVNHKSNHMAQDNIKTRLKLLYGDASRFNIESGADTYRVSLEIPLNRSV